MDWTLTGIARAVRGVYGRAVNKASLPTYNQDDPAPLAFDLATGRLLVDATGGGGGADTQYTSGTTQSAPTGNAILGQYATSAPTLTNNELYAAQLDVSGNLKVNVAAGGTSGTQYTGSPAVTAGTQIETLSGGYDGTNVRSIKCDTTGTLYVNQGHLAGTTDTVSISDSTGLNKVSVDSSGRIPANIQQVGGSALTLGQTTKSASVPVTLASDQGNLGISGTVTANIGTLNGLAQDSTLSNVQSTAGTTTAPTKIGIIGGKTTDATAQYQPLPLNNGGAAVKVDLSGTASNSTNVNVAVQSAPANQSVNITQISGSAVATAATGIAKVGLTDATGNALNSTSNALNVSIQNTTIASVPTPSSTVTATTIFQVNNLTGSKQQIKASSGRIYYYHFYNPNSSVVYIQLFDVANASITLGTTAPSRVIAIPALGVLDTGFTIGQSYGTAINLAATTTATGSTAPTSNLTATIDYI